MKYLSGIGLVFGLVILTALIIWQGLVEILHLLFSSGWLLLLIPLAWIPNIYPTTESWRLLFEPERKPPMFLSLMAMWLGRAVNNLLPVATLGGEIVKARILILNGTGASDAMASVLVDKTVQAIALILWGLIGIVLLLYLALNNVLALTALAGFGILAVGVIGFFLVQKAGLYSMLTGFCSKLIRNENWEGISVDAKITDSTVMNIYENWQCFTYSCFLKTIGLVVQTAEVWLACYLFGFPISIIETMMLKSLTSTLTDIAFIIPNGYGIQEGAYILIGTLLGMTPDLALTVSLAIRIRELIIDLPGLLYWQLIEGRLWLKKNA
jgi:putative membrane protein